MAVEQAASRYQKSDVERLIPAWEQELGATPRRRIRTVAGLLDDSGLGSLAACHAATFPAAKDPKPSFNKLIERANSSAQDAGVDIKLVVDSRKKSPTDQRHCWFEPRTSIADRADQFTREAVKPRAGETPIPSHLREDTSHLPPSTKRTVRYFLSYAHDNHGLAMPLMKLLETRFRNSPNFVFEKWSDQDIDPGEGWKEEIDRALADCHFGLLLVSPEFLASRFITAEELPVFLEDGKPCIPVGLSRFDFEATDTKGLIERQVFLHRRKKKGNTWFDENRQAPNNTDFATELAMRIERRIRTAVDQGSIVPEEARPSSLVTDPVTSEIDDSTHDRDNGEELDHFLHEQTLDADVAHYEPNRAQATSLKDASPKNSTGEQVVAIDFLSDWADDENAAPYFALLGEYGIGKTTTLKHFARIMLERRSADPQSRRVIYLDLRRVPGSLIEKRGDQLTLEDILTSTLKGQWDSTQALSLTPGDLIHLVRHERAIIIFDGLDEVTVKLSSNDAQQFIRQLWSVLPPNLFPADDALLTSDTKRTSDDVNRLGRVVISCRSHYFKDLQQQTSLLLGERRESVRAEHYQAAFILPFNDQQISNYLSHTIGEAHLERTLQLIQEVHNLKDLAKRPYLLNLITGQLPQLERMKAQGKTVNGATLYCTMTREWLERDDGKHHIPEEDKRLIMEQLALDMWVDGNRFWKWERLYQWLRDFFRDHPEVRQACGNVSNELLEEDLRTATFILRPDDEEQRFRFAHTSLQEFFLASGLHRALLEAGRLRATGKPDTKIKEVLHCWNIPVPSLETLEFLGQLIETDDEQERTRRALATVLEGVADVERRAQENSGPPFGNKRPSAALVAFRYWLLAVEKNLPEPAKCRVVLAGLNLSHLEIHGASSGQPLSLRGADFSGCNLVGTKFRFVDLSGANLSGVRAEFAEFLNVEAAGAHVENANLTGILWRGGSMAGFAGVDSVRWSGARLIDVGGVDESLALRVSAVSRPSATTQSRPLPRSAGLSLTLGHSSLVSACSFSPDGKTIVSGSYDNTLRIWDAASGDELKTLQGHGGAVSACSFSPDGKTIVSGSYDNTLRIWDAASGDELKTLQGHSSAVRACSFSPDGKMIVSGSDDNTLRIWDAASGDELKTLQGHSSAVRACSFSPDGKTIVSGSDDNTLRIWDAASGDELKTLQGHSSLVSACSFSPDGKTIVSGSYDNTLRIWDAASGDELKTLQGHSSLVLACSFSPDGKTIVSGSFDKTLRLWDAASGDELKTLQGHTNWVLACSFSPDGKTIVSASYDNTLRIWDAASGDELKTLQGHGREVRACSFSPDGKTIVSGSDDNTLRICDAASGDELKTLQGHSSAVRACSFSPDGKMIVSGSDDNTLRIWDAASGDELKTLQGHGRSVLACSFSPDGKTIVSGSYDNTLRIWDAASGDELKTLQGHSSEVRACSFSPDGKTIVSGSDDNTLRLWDAASGDELKTLQGHSSAVHACGFSPDGRTIVSASDDKTLRLWDADSGAVLKTLQGHSSGVSACSFSPDGKTIVSGSDDNTLRIWDAASGDELKTLQGHSSGVSACSFSPDGKTIVSGSHDNTLRIWDLSSGVDAASQSLALLSLLEAQAAVDLSGNRILWASQNAWRYLGWEYNDETTGRPGLLPAEHFGPLPTSPVPHVN